jgi:regulator of nonsense transcripts 3
MSKLVRSKVVVRNLPPLLPGSEFKAVVDTIASDAYDWFYFVQGKTRCERVFHTHKSLLVLIGWICSASFAIFTMEVSEKGNLLHSTKRIKTSHAFIHFKVPADLLKFKDCIEKHTFVNERGVVYHCTVEFAPSQKIPPSKVKRDPRENTLEKGEDDPASGQDYFEIPSSASLFWLPCPFMITYYRRSVTSSWT